MLETMFSCELNHCVLKRRDFIAALFAGVASCRLGHEVWSQPMTALMTPVTGGTLTLKVSDFPALGSVGGSIGLMYDTNFPVLIGRVAAGFNVFRGQCPHAGGVVVPAGTQFFCTNHGSFFNHEGLAVSGQAAGGSLPICESGYDAGNDRLRVSLPDMAYRISVLAASGADRLRISFEAVPGVKYEIRYRGTLEGSEQGIAFSTTPAGPLSTTEITASGSGLTVYVQKTGIAGFYLVNVKVRQL